MPGLVSLGFCGIEKCEVGEVSAKCVTFCLSRVSNNSTYVWLVGVFRRRSRGSCRVVCILQSFALHLMQSNCVYASVFYVWVVLLVHFSSYNLPNLYYTASIFTRLLSHHIT